MAAPFHKLIVCPVLIDRVSDLATLHELIDQAHSGQGQVALLSGEAGDGKSRLVAKAKAYAATKGFLLLQGNCFSADVSYPYTPLLDLLRSSAANHLAATTVSELAPFARELHQLLPDVVLLPPDQAPQAPSDPEQEKRRLFAFFGHFGRGLAHAQRGLRIATEIDHQQWIAGAHCYLGHIYVLMLAPKEALRHLEVGLALAKQLGSSWWVGNIVAYLALAYLLQGERGRAEAELQAVISPVQRPYTLPERRLLWVWSELALAQGKPEVCLDKVFPDFRYDISRIFAHDDLVCAEWILTGTHQGAIPGPGGKIEPTGKTVSVPGCFVFRVADGKVSEYIGHVDFLGMYAQMGAVSPISSDVGHR